MQDVETKGLEESFDAILHADRLTGMEARMDAFDEALRKQAERAAALAGRPPLDGAKGGEVDPARAAFTERYLRRGIEAGVELKNFSGTSGASGGYAVPREIDQMIEATLKSISPIRAVANVVRTGSAGYRKLVTTVGVVSGWAAETGARPETATPTFQEIAPPSGELYANPSASQAMLDDAQFDVESWLAGEIAREFAQAEGAAFINGDGTSKPKGFLTYTATNQACRRKFPAGAATAT